MTRKIFFASIAAMLLNITVSTGQDAPARPAINGTGTYLGLTPPLRDLPVVMEEEFAAMHAEALKERNEELRFRSYPFAGTALPKGPDPAWQREMGSTRSARELVMNFNGQQSPYFPPDANGTAGPQYYMQSINTVYAIYNKATGTIAAGPTNINQLFSGVPGANCNDGDPIFLYDEQADRWLASEFSICGSNDRMLIAVSQTNDPTGSWHKYSFDVADLPDYPKFGVWQDGYYLGTNNSSGNDIYVFERSKMLNGEAAQMVGFNNPWRPGTIDGFMCVPPVDNDGVAAPLGEPGLFITINDDAIGGGADQLWIYELDVDWTTLSNSTFNRVQMLNVPAFDSNFGNTWNNIPQPGTGQKLDAIPMVVMNRPQYRNFGSFETIVCCHTVDLNATNHAGIRWYELRRNGADWTIRQSGTYGPDEHNRWLGSVSLNGFNEIGLAYSVSSSTVYPGIRYCGQSATEYAAASGILDVAEEIIQTGTNSQTGANRWGDYADMSVDPENDKTFWFTSQYGGSRQTKIAAFEFSPAALTAMFSASNETPCPGETIVFTDQSAGAVTSWNWTFEGGTPATSTEQNPEVLYDTPGAYDVELTVSDGTNSNSLLRENFIQVLVIPGQPGMPSGPQDICRGDASVEYMINSIPDAMSYEWIVNPPEAGNFSGNDTIGTLAVSEVFEGQMWIKVRALNNCGNSGFSDSLLVTVHPGPQQYNMGPDGAFCEGGEGVEVTLDGSETNTDYELFLDGITTGSILSGTGNMLSFGFRTETGIYTIEAISFNCSIEMNGSTTISLLPVAGQPATPTGSTEECNSNKGTEYTTTGASNADYYSWQIIPADAGIISGNTVTAAVDWSAEFSGTALISVSGVNECGPGPASNALQVAVINAPHPSIEGESEVCSQSAGEVYFYSTQDNDANEYFWTITGGNIIMGQGTHQVLVSWTAFISGSLTVRESSPLGCETVSDPFQVNINDCTGIPERVADRVFIYPNPVLDEMTLKCSLAESGTARIMIFSSFGQEVFLKEIKTGNGEINHIISTSDLSAGTYSVKIISPSGKLFEGRFVKSK
jgi:PKD repeat protein